jgi:hypothetical protein
MRKASSIARRGNNLRQDEAWHRRGQRRGSDAWRHRRRGIDGDVDAWRLHRLQAAGTALKLMKMMRRIAARDGMLSIAPSARAAGRRGGPDGTSPVRWLHVHLRTIPPPLRRAENCPSHGCVHEQPHGEQKSNNDKHADTHMSACTFAPYYYQTHEAYKAEFLLRGERSLLGRHVRATCPLVSQCNVPALILRCTNTSNPCISQNCPLCGDRRPEWTQQ